MRNLLALIGAAVVVFAGLGWYLGWYQLGTQPGTDGHRTINVDLNTKKIQQDEQKAVDFIKKETSGTPGTPTPKTVEGQPTSNNGGPPVLPKLETNTGN
jgi:hypothetical protein